MRLVTLLVGVLFSVSCVGPAALPGDWEYRVLDSHDYYGLESAEELSAVALGEGFLDHLVPAMRRWAAEGWYLVPSELAGGRLLLRRARSNPTPFEVQCVMQKELAEASAATVQARINQLIHDGWTLAADNALWLEFRRYR